MEEKLPICGYMALPAFRTKAEGKLTDCIAEPGHRGNHVYCLPVNAGISGIRSYALHYFEEINRKELKPVMNVDMEGHVLEANQDMCASVWQIMEYQKERRG